MLNEKLINILKELDGLSTEQIQVMLANVDQAVKKLSIVNLEHANKATFNADIKPLKNS